jgi:hypothetical protein
MTGSERVIADPRIKCRLLGGRRGLTHTTRPVRAGLDAISMSFAAFIHRAGSTAMRIVRSTKRPRRRESSGRGSAASRRARAHMAARRRRGLPEQALNRAHSSRATL